jgi:hypothetical protein
MSAAAGPGRAEQAARAGAGVAFVQAIFLPHGENCFATYQARSTCDVTAGVARRLRFDRGHNAILSHQTSR